MLSVEKLLEESLEAREYQREIGEMLANTLTLDEEDAVQAELRELEADVLRDAEPLHIIDLPMAPKTQPVSTDDRQVVHERVPVPI